jgi:signal transduction histidine kinase
VISHSPALPTLITERVPLEIVLRNLIGNAIKHHHRPAGHIQVAVVEEERMLTFAVTDDGPGIDPEYHQRIFEMFQTLRPRDQVEGSGMGLTVVKKIVENYGGAITVESQLGQGTTLRFTWPSLSPEP